MSISLTLDNVSQKIRSIRVSIFITLVNQLFKIKFDKGFYKNPKLISFKLH